MSADWVGGQHLAVCVLLLCGVRRDRGVPTRQPCVACEWQQQRQPDSGTASAGGGSRTALQLGMSGPDMATARLCCGGSLGLLRKLLELLVRNALSGGQVGLPLG